MMRVILDQPDGLAPGFARLILREAPAMDPGSVVFALEQPPRGFLQAYGSVPWGSTMAWHRPNGCEPGEDGLVLTLGPDQTWNLKPNVTYKLRVRAGEAGEPVDLRVAWKAIRMPSQAPAALPALAPLQAPPPAAAETVPATASATPAPESERLPPGGGRSSAPTAPVAVPPGRRRWLWIAPLPVLLAVAVGAWFVMQYRPPPPAAMTPPPEGPLDAANARRFVQLHPGAAEASAEAQHYLQKGTPEALQGALVLLNHAAGGGDGPAATAIGRMYDPDGFSPKTSAMQAPDADKARLWYQRAAQANDPEGLYRLGKLLLAGQTPEAPQGLDYLRRAARLGYRPAQLELEQRHAQPQ